MRKRWKWRINNKIKISAMVLLAFCFVFAGCGFLDSGISLGSRTHKAEEALKEKYGCEVEVLSSWTSGGSLCVTCIPKYDKTMVFEAQLAGDCSEIWSDTYMDSVIAYQVNRQLEEDLQEFFPGCVVSSGYAASMEGNYLSFAHASDATLEMFVERYPQANYYTVIHVDRDKLKDNNIEKEYQYFSETLRDKVKAGTFPVVTIGITYVDSEKMQQCKQYFKTNYEKRGEYDDIVSGCYEFGFGYVSGEINKTYEEYEELRMGGK